VELGGGKLLPSPLLRFGPPHYKPVSVRIARRYCRRYKKSAVAREGEPGQSVVLVVHIEESLTGFRVPEFEDVVVT
jgi:hypothetical protein